MVVTLWQEMEGKPKRTYTANLERDREHLSLLGLTHAPPYRTSLYRTRRRLTERAQLNSFLRRFTVKYRDSQL
jgi:hypothetical protein